MIMRPVHSTLGHSAMVRIELRINGSIIPVAKIGPNQLFLTRPQTIDYDRGEVVMFIDGHQRRWPVVLNAPAGPCQIIPADFGVAE